MKPKPKRKGAVYVKRAVHLNIRRLREGLGLSQAEFADRLGFGDKSLVSHWERGECSPRSSKLPAVAALLKCSIDELLTGAP